MLKRTIKYTNFDGVESEETFYFNLTKAELLEMEYDVENGTLTDLLTKIQKDRNIKGILAETKKFILKSVGERDGEMFRKSDEIRDRFLSHPAYDVLFLELSTAEGDEAGEFMLGILPADLAEEAEKVTLQQKMAARLKTEEPVRTVEGDALVDIPTDSAPSTAELIEQAREGQG